MAKSRSLQVVISGDAKQLQRAFGNVDRSAATTEGKLKRFGGVARGVFAGAGIAAGGALVLGLKSSVTAAVEAEKSQVKLRTQLQSMGKDADALLPSIDNVITRQSRMFAVDDEALQDSYTNLVRMTGDVKKAHELNALAADVARAKDMDLATASTLVGKVATGNTTVLKRYGITVKEGATSTEALGELQKRFAGQAKAYGDSTAGAQDRFKVATENLQEAIGKKLLPILADVTTKAARFVEGMQDGTGAGGRFADKMKGVARDMRPFLNAMKSAAQFLGEHPGLIAAAAGAYAAFRVTKGVVSAFGTVKTAAGTMHDSMKWMAKTRLGQALVDNMKTGLRPLRDTVVSAAQKLREPFQRSLERTGMVAGDSLASQTAQGTVTGMDKRKGRFSRIGGSMGKLFGVAFVVAALPVIGERIQAGLKAYSEGKKKGGAGVSDLPIIKFLFPGAGDGIGKINNTFKRWGEGAASLFPFSAGVQGKSLGASGGLMGADKALAPFARLAGQAGLRVSSGRRAAGGLTSSGNISYHGSGEAIDVADGTPGPSAAKMRFFRAMKSRFGRRLAELIYTPGGAGIKDGRPYTYGGRVAADHLDHVHVALDLGRPGAGIGDGIGRKPFTGDGVGTPERNAKTVLAVGRRLGASPKEMLAAIQTILVEANGLDVNYGDRDSSGAFQQRPSQGWGPASESLATDAAQFFRAAKSANRPNLSAGELAQAVQRSAYPTRYAEARTKALALMARVSGSVSGSSRSGGSSRVVRATEPKRVPAPTYGPRGNPRTYEQTLANIDVGEAQGKPTALFERAFVMRQRLDKINRDLRKKMRPEVRLRLTQERAQLIGDLKQIGVDNAAAMAGPDAPEPATNEDRLSQQSIAAQLSGDPARIKAAADYALQYREYDYQRALGTADPRDDVETGQALISAREAVRQLTEATEAATAEATRLAEQEVAARQAQTEALNALAVEFKRNADIAASVQAIDNRTLTKSLADLLSGEIVGRGFAARQQSPGIGTLARY